MFLNDIVDALTVKEARAIKQRLDAKCWTGKHKEGTKIKGGVRVNNCVPNESVEEAANAAQQAAIAINMKKAHKKPKHIAEATGDERFDTMMGRMQKEPRIPDPQMPPTDVRDLYQWAVKNNKPYHKIFATWANREGFKSVAPALQKAGNLDSDALDYWTPAAWKAYYGDDSEMPQSWSKERIPDELRDYLETVFDAYDHIWTDWPTEYRQIGEQGVAEGQRWPDDRNSLSKNDRDIELINPKDADVKWKDRKIATKISPSITKTTVDRLDRNTTVPNFLKKKTEEDSTKGQVDEILGFQTAKPAAKKPNTSLSQMRKEFEKEPVAPQPKVVQSRDADEKKAREVHKQYAEEDASGWPFKNGIDEDSWSDGQGQWSSEHDQWAHESLNEYPAAASVPADSSSAIPGTPGLNESQQQRLERLEIQWRLQEMKAAGYDL